MKKFIYALVALGVIGVSGIADADNRLTSSEYFTIREKLRNGKFTDFQYKKVCDTLTGLNVDFESRVASVEESGRIIADMDMDSMLSIPEIFLWLSSNDKLDSIKPAQTIRYHGSIADCKYKSVMGTLFLSIEGGTLMQHY